MEASDYLKQIGKRGGQKKSRAKADAARENLRLAREALKNKREADKKVSQIDTNSVESSSI